MMTMIIMMIASLGRLAVPHRRHRREVEESLLSV